MLNIGDVFFRIRGDFSGLEGDAKKAAEQTVKQLEGFARNAQTMKKVGTAMTVGVTVPVLLGARKVRDAFAELQDSTGAVQQVYGESSAKLIEWVDNVKEATGHYYGYSRGMALSAASTIQPLIRAFAEGEQQADVTIEMLKRASDMSAYAGGTIDEALGAISSGLSGTSFEPLRRYGVVLNEAALAAVAVREGIIDTSLKEREAIFKREDAQKRLTEAVEKYGEGSREAEEAAIALGKAEEALTRLNDGRGVVLSASQRQEAAYIAIMEQSAYMAGQYEREVNSLSGSMKEKDAAAERLAETMGEKAAPAMIAYYEAQTKVWETIGGLPDELLQVAAAAAGLGAVTGPVLGFAGAIGEMAANYKLLKAVRDVGGATGSAAGGGLLAGLGRGLGRGLGAVGRGVGAVGRGGLRLAGRAAAPIALALGLNELGRFVPGSEGRNFAQGAAAGIAERMYGRADPVDTSTQRMVFETAEKLISQGYDAVTATRMAQDIWNVEIHNHYTHQPSPEERARDVEFDIRGVQRARGGR